VSSVESRYNPAAIEEKWQQTWAELGLDQTPQIQISLNSMLCLCFYPSGSLHMGHVRNYVTDVIARLKRMQGPSTAPNGMGRVWFAS